MSGYRKLRSGKKMVIKNFEFLTHPIEGQSMDFDEEEEVDNPEEGFDDDIGDIIDDIGHREQQKRSPNLYPDLKPELNQLRGERSQRNTKRQQKKNDSQREEPSKKSSLCFWIFVLISTIFALYCGYYSNQYYSIKLSPNETNSVIKWQTFETEFNLFQQKYSEVLPTLGLKVLKSSVKRVIDRNILSQIGFVSPAVVLLIASEVNQNVLKCVERDFVETITKAYSEDNPIVINGRQTNSRDIIDKFDQNFRDQRKHTIIIENIESIDANDVMSLHQFTDHQNAKYKDVIIVLTAIHYQNINLTKKAKLMEMDSIATQLLQIKWKNVLPEEQSFALISRLTPSVVTIIVKPTNQFKC